MMRSLGATPEGYFNHFHGFEGKKLANYDPDRITLTLKHIKEVLAKGDEKAEELILDLLAHIIQYPHIKIPKMMLFLSDEGAGKNLFFNNFAEKVIGEMYSRIINDIENLTGNFNSIVKNSIFVIANEIDNLRKHGSKIKDLLDNKEVWINEKFLAPYKSGNYFFMVMLTNNIRYFNVEEKQRRVICFRCSDKYVKDHGYYAELAAEIEALGWGDHMRTYLSSRDLTNFSVYKADFYKTPFHESIEGLSHSSAEIFAREYQIAGMYMKKKDVKYAYWDWCNKEGYECEDIPTLTRVLVNRWEEKRVTNKVIDGEKIKDLKLYHNKLYEGPECFAMIKAVKPPSRKLRHRVEEKST